MARPALLRRSPDDREILRLAVPALGALVAEPLYVLTDTAIVGRLGTAQLGGVAVASAVLLFIHSLTIFLAYGTTGTVARMLGRGRSDLATGYGVQALWLAAALGVVLAVVVAVLSRPLVVAFGAEDDVVAFALTYLRISLVGVPALLVTMAGTGYLRGAQDTVTPLVVAVGTALLNLGLELLMVFQLDLGVAGSAWSTVIAQFVGVSAYLAVIARDARRSSLPLRPVVAGMAGIGRTAGPLVLRTAMLRGSFLFATATAAGIGTAALAAHEIGMALWSLAALALDAIAIAGQALVGRHVGSGDALAARRSSRRMIEWSVAVGVVLGVAFVALRDVLPQLFTADPEVIELAALVLVFVGVMQPLNGYVFALDGILIGAGDLRYLAAAMSVAAVAFIVLALAVRLTGGRLGWLWAALVALTAMRALGLFLRYRTDRWLDIGREA